MKESGWTAKSQKRGRKVNSWWSESERERVVMDLTVLVTCRKKKSKKARRSEEE